MKHAIRPLCLAALLCAAASSFAADNGTPGMASMSKTTDDNPATDPGGRLPITRLQIRR